MSKDFWLIGALWQFKVQMGNKYLYFLAPKTNIYFQIFPNLSVCFGVRRTRLRMRESVCGNVLQRRSRASANVAAAARVPGLFQIIVDYPRGVV